MCEPVFFWCRLLLVSTPLGVACESSHKSRKMSKLPPDANNQAKVAYDDRGKYWIVTVHHDAEDPEGIPKLQNAVDDVQALFDAGELEHAVGQFEYGDEGRLHIQAYLIFKERKYRNWITSRIYRSFILKSQANWAPEGVKYCNDPEKKGFERTAFVLGNMPSATQGRRTDLESVDDAIGADSVTTLREVNDLRVSVAANQATWAKWRLAEAAKDAYLKEERYDATYEPRVWQYWLARILTETPPAERLIYFIVDPLGTAGKSRFCFEYERQSPKRIQFLRAAPKRDMVAALENRRDVVFIDVPRGRGPFMETVYVFMEEAKDGRLINEKYGSHIVHQPRLHLVVMMNEDVDVGQDAYHAPGAYGPESGSHFTPRKVPLTHDRYAIWNFGELQDLCDVWSPDHPRWGTTCPPFKTFQADMVETAYTPPLVNRFGSAFSSDVTGDGPLVGTEAITVIIGLDPTWLKIDDSWKEMSIVERREWMRTHELPPLVPDQAPARVQLDHARVPSTLNVRDDSSIVEGWSAVDELTEEVLQRDPRENYEVSYESDYDNPCYGFIIECIKSKGIATKGQWREYVKGKPHFDVDELYDPEGATFKHLKGVYGGWKPTQIDHETGIGWWLRPTTQTCDLFHHTFQGEGVSGDRYMVMRSTVDEMPRDVYNRLEDIGADRLCDHYVYMQLNADVGHYVYM